MYKVFNTITKYYIINAATFEHCIYTKEQAKELARTYTQLTRQKHKAILIK